MQRFREFFDETVSEISFAEQLATKVDLLKRFFILTKIRDRIFILSSILRNINQMEIKAIADLQTITRLQRELQESNAARDQNVQSD
jgi:hypothetical protein